MKKFRIWAQFSPYTGNIDFGFLARDFSKQSFEPGSLSAAEPLVFKPLDANIGTGPQLSLDKEAARELMDHLWHAGIRPSENLTGNGALDATKAHLADMQKISTRLLDSVLKPELRPMFINSTPGKLHQSSCASLDDVLRGGQRGKPCDCNV